MGALETLLIACSVSIDAFAVSVGGSLCDRSGRRYRNAMRAALFFGGFQILMPLIGYFAAQLLARVVAQLDHWIAFLLLGVVGGRMIFEGLKASENVAPSGQPCCGEDSGSFFDWKALFVPAVATSLDALAVGAGIAFAGAPIWGAALAMGVVTAATSITGVLIGNRIGSLAGERTMSVIGGGAIILIGVKILLEHLGIF